MDWLRSLPTFDDPSVIVVVDGGGTGSRAAVADASGTLLGYAEGGPTNGRSAGDDEAAANVAAVIADALAAAGGALTATSVLVSSASVDTQAHADVLIGGVRAVGAVAPDATITAVADTIGCWAATAAMAPAVAVIAGTGSAVLAGSLEQGSRRYGGWDYVLGDEGSGYALGRAALREVLLAAEGSAPDGPLVATTRARLGIDETDELFDRIYKPEVDKSMIASFAEDVIDLAGGGDAEARRLLGEQTGLLADTVAAAFRDFRDLGTLGCFGGIWNAEVYRASFAAALAARVEEMPRIVHPGDTAMAGSFRVVLRRAVDGVAGAAEDAAVDRFASALVEAKAQAKAAADDAA